MFRGEDVRRLDAQAGRASHPTLSQVHTENPSKNMQNEECKPHFAKPTTFLVSAPSSNSDRSVGSFNVELPPAA
jgi:hypothetical protein